jgi:hypothetical protein
MTFFDEATETLPREKLASLQLHKLQLMPGYGAVAQEYIPLALRI